MTEYKKPLPVPNLDSQAFWEGCKKHELLIPRCQNCGNYHFYPRFFCPKCLSNKLEWIKSSGKGKIYTFTIIERAGMEAFKEEVPYVLAIVELEEGVRMMSNIVKCGLDEIEIGMSLEVVFDDVTNEITLPKFKPVS